MPIHTYECPSCNHAYEVYERRVMPVPLRTKCPKCGEQGKRVISAMARTPGKWTVEKQQEAK